MKKYLPIILVIIGLAAVVLIVFAKLGNKRMDVEVEEEAPEVSLEMRPVASLTPSVDGYWLKLMIDKVLVKAETLDYELLYKLSDGRTQGVPGTVTLKNGVIERDLLLGSESSGIYRYDEGVEQGKLTLRLRDEDGKLVSKFETEFHLQENTDELYSLDRKIVITNEGKIQKGYTVIMQTFGLPDGYPKNIISGPYGVFSSAESLMGEIVMGKGSLYMYSGDGWDKVENGETVIGNFAIFVLTSE